jgi:hypothetical protein
MRRIGWGVVAMALVGCAPDGAVPDGWAMGDLDADDMRSVLVDDARSAFAERTRVRHETRATQLPGGAVMPGDTWWSPAQAEHVAVDIRDDQIGVLIEQRTVQLVVWLDRIDLDLVPVVDTWIGGDDAGVRVPAGTALEPTGVGAGATRIAVANAVVAVDAWVDDRALDHVWYADAPAEPWHVEPFSGPWLRVLPGTELLDAPDGEPFARVQPDREASYAAVDAREGPWVRVAFEADGWPVEAWVHELDTDGSRRFGVGGSGGSFGCGGAWGGVRPNVEAGTLLHAGPEGPVIGRVTRDTWLSVDADEGAWLHTTIATAYGEVSVAWEAAHRLPWRVNVPVHFTYE